jgi:hypothetical protein
MDEFKAAGLKRKFFEAREAGKPKPTLLLDELQYNMTPEVTRFVDGCVMRGTSKNLSVPMPDGSWKNTDIDTFGPVGLAGTKPSPPEMATREIVIPMQKVELDRLTSTLADRLNKDEWRRENRGGPVDSRWLGQMLRGRLEPLGAQDYYVWSPGPKARAIHYSVYYRAQFKRVFSEEFSPEAWDRAQRGIFPKTINLTGETGEAGEPDSPDDLNDHDLQPIKLDLAHSQVSPASPEPPDASPGESEASLDGPAAPKQSRPLSPVSPVSGDPEEKSAAAPDAFEEALRQLHQANPSRSAKWLSARLRQPEARIRRALGLPPKSDSPRRAP